MKDLLQARIDASEAACEALMARLVAGNARLLADLHGFRGEFREGFRSARGDFAAVKAEQVRQGERLDQVQATLAEVLRRLPEPGQEH